MKKIIEFNIPEDSEEFELHNKGPVAVWLIGDILERLRYDLKHRDDIYEMKTEDYIDELRDWISEEVTTRGLESLI